MLYIYMLKESKEKPFTYKICITKFETLVINK